jgi:hypothetical protein
MNKILPPTPGNWLHKDGTVFSETGHIICQLVSGRYHNESSDRIAEREANGRLLASSPRLAECIQKILFDQLNGATFKHDQILSLLAEAYPEMAANYIRVSNAQRSA